MKGICFKPHLHELTIQGVKTQTRRIIVSRTGYFQVCSRDGVITNIWQTDADEWTGDNLTPVKPRYNVGEVLYLKEPIQLFVKDFGGIDEELGIAFQYGNKQSKGISTALYPVWLEKAEKEGLFLEKEDSEGYRMTRFLNKLFMPEWSARHFITITAVRTERLQDITEKDCIREGITLEMAMDANTWQPTYNDPDSGGYPEYRKAYAALIDSINGKSTWDSNPYVWVYDYELVQPQFFL